MNLLQILDAMRQACPVNGCELEIYESPKAQGIIELRWNYKTKRGENLDTVKRCTRQQIRKLSKKDFDSVREDIIKQCAVDMLTKEPKAAWNPQKESLQHWRHRVYGFGGFSPI